jgi:hypothetical protein
MKLFRILDPFFHAWSDGKIMRSAASLFCPLMGQEMFAGSAARG